jgi:hypothetical protein
MEPNLNLISAKELFGEASRLTVQEATEAVTDITSLGAIYQVTTGVVALLFILVLARYSEQFRYLMLSFVNKNVKQTEMHIYAAELHNIKIFMGIVGISFISLFTMRLSITENMRHLIYSIEDLPVWGNGIIFFGATLLMILLERFSLYLIGLVSEQGKFCNEIWHLKMLHFATTTTILTPLLVLMLLTEGFAAEISLYIAIFLCIISLILFIKDSFLLFRSQRFSIFHWILYLCALEIFPLSLLVAPIVRG